MLVIHVFTSWHLMRCFTYFVCASWASLMIQWVKNPPAMQEIHERQIWSLGWENSLEEENDNPLQYSCLGNPMDREAWQATVHGVTKESDILHEWAHTINWLTPGNWENCNVLRLHIIHPWFVFIVYIKQGVLTVTLSFPKRTVPSPRLS